MQVTDRAKYLLREKGVLSIGAARDQLVIEGVATDINNPLLRELAGRLRRHHLGAISFHQGVSKSEVLQFLNLMAEEPDLSGQSLGLGPPERREQQPNIHMHPVAYDSLRLLDDDGNIDEDRDAQAARTRFAQLWVGLAKAAVTRAGRDDQPPDDETDGDPEEVSRDPKAVAQAISEHSESDAYDHCHFASKLVHVCDVYDALRTKRPYRDPWSAKKVLAYIEEKSGTEFDSALAQAFKAMIGQWEPRLANLDEDEPLSPPVHSSVPVEVGPRPPD